MSGAASMMENTNIAIILAGGVGSRMGHKLPKQYIEVEGKPIIHYTLIPFIKSGLFEQIIICAEPQWHDYILENLPSGAENLKFEFSRPGETRQFTIFNSLKKVEEICPTCEVVLIHDAARPLVSPELIYECYSSLKDADGILPVIRVKDTIYQSLDGKHVNSLLDRSTLYAGQAPEAFRFRPYLKAHLDSTSEEISKINGSSELALLKGLKVDMIKGDENNFKVTTPEDLDRFKQILKENDR